MKTSEPPRQAKKLSIRASSLAAALCISLGSGAAAEDTPQVRANQHYIEAARAGASLDITDKRAVFQHVLNSLPGTVTVYPTENYYYFYFHLGGIRYAGNIRLDVEDRDKGLVHVNYFKDFTPWQRDETSYSAIWGAKDGVAVTRLAPLVYRIASAGKTVEFKLIDLSDHKPPAGLVRSGETYIGPVFDESGMQFFLLFNPQLKVFHYILDETVPVADELMPSATSGRVVVGTRTGFAFYRDQHTSRLILIGVYAQNTQVNNYLDGPFDQLPDNFIKGDILKDAILAASPEMKGQIDRFGNSPDDETRYLIAPYMLYEDQADLDLIADCAGTEDLPTYYACFSFENPDEDEG